MASPADDTINIVVGGTLPGVIEENTTSSDIKNAKSPSSIISDITPEGDILSALDGTNIPEFKSETEELIRLFRSLTILTPIQIRIIELRYLSLLRFYKNRMLYIDFFHHFTRSFVSLGSVVVPALLSIQSPTTTNYSIGLYWTTWIISVFVTIFHNFVTIFRFEKKYFALHTTYEKLNTEGWCYLQLSGRYSGHDVDSINSAKYIHPTHKNQFALFVLTIEKIQMRQIANEYNGQSDEKTKPLLNAPVNQDLTPLDSVITSPLKK